MIKSLKFVKIQSLWEARPHGIWPENFPRGPEFGFVGKFALGLVTLGID